jgi:putative PIN family toxin of toxin-antitoxin system
MRIVLDTDILIASVRSKTGASRSIMRMIERRQLTAVATVPMLIEYEAVLTRPEHLAAANLTRQGAENIISALAALLLPVEPHFSWRPQLTDPNDEMILEAAVNGQAMYIITFNTRHFMPAVQRFGLDALTPRDFLRRIRP